MSTDILVDPSRLTHYLDDPRTVLIDARGADDYWAGHLPGARHLDIGLFAHYDTSPAGLAALAGQYAYLFSQLGLSGDEHVVVYENRSDSKAARVAWLLDYLGHPAVSLLDGGLALVRDIPLEQAARAHAPRRLVAQVQAPRVVAADEIHARLDEPGFRVLDTRRATEYHGEEKRAKHAGAIPGAVHRDYADNIGPDGRFLPADQLRAAYTALGLRPDDEIAAYCGGGVRAAHTYFALKLAGFDKARNYSGSWGEWGNRDDLPVAVPPRPVAAATTP